MSRAAALILSIIGFASCALAQDRATFATNWLAEAEHGGFYQAKADGTYARFGLDVTILPGGPQANHRLALAAGKIEFNLAANLIQTFDAALQKTPIVAVAAVFQKDPFILMSHPDAGFDRFEDLPKARAFIGKDAFVSVYQWLRSAYGFRDDMIRPYAFNAAPFLRDNGSIQQGYVTSEPFLIEREGGFRPNVFLLADYGYDSYSTLIETRRDLIEKNPGLVRRFVEASLIGWIHYVEGDGAAADALILKDNPDMTPELLAYSRGRIKALRMLYPGAGQTGVGTMDEGRIRSFFAKMAAAGLFPAGLDVSSALDLSFVGEGASVEKSPGLETGVRP